MKLNPIDRVSFDAAELLKEHPPRWHHSNKQLVYEIGCSSGFPIEGQVEYARWPAQKLPESVPPLSQFTVRTGLFDYAVEREPNVVAWHLNFSDPNLFVAYGSSLLAQDELQVAEHPILGSISEALHSLGMAAVTEDKQGNPTPVTITGVQRRCAIDTLPNPAAGLLGGLYGNAFARAKEEQVKSATRPLSPPTISNILAMAAPAGGYREYCLEEMIKVLTTAYTGFLAARAESNRLVNGVSRTVIHTGFWGCGAFGGNRRLMTILQSLAGDLAGVEIVFWAFDEAGKKVAADARDWYHQQRERNTTVKGLLEQCVEERFLWGVSDGN
jgi:hypothetical protein